MNFLDFTAIKCCVIRRSHFSPSIFSKNFRSNFFWANGHYVRKHAIFKRAPHLHQKLKGYGWSCVNKSQMLNAKTNINETFTTTINNLCSGIHSFSTSPVLHRFPPESVLSHPLGMLLIVRSSSLKKHIFAILKWV